MPYRRRTSSQEHSKNDIAAFLTYRGARYILAISLLRVVFIVLSTSNSRVLPHAHKPYKLGTKVELDRVVFRSIPTRTAYNPFQRHLSGKAESMYATEVLTPKLDRTRAVVVIYAGQQGFEDGFHSRMTGQQKGYKAGWPSSSGTRATPLESGSLAENILGCGLFNKHRTSVTMFFDHQFEYQDSVSSKESNVAAHVEYILAKTGKRTELIYLVGHSRGGCLILRAAKSISTQRPDIDVIITAYDPVCVVPGQLLRPEMGITRKYIRNPVNSNARVATTNMTAQYDRQKSLSIRSFLSGQNVAGWLPVNSFGHLDFGEVEQSIWLGGQRPWYTQSFHKENHGDITYKYYEAAETHLREALRAMKST